jgi:hypothetical protein
MSANWKSSMKTNRQDNMELVHLDKQCNIECYGVIIMTKKRRKVTLTIIETEPDPMSEDDHERRLDAALDAVASMVCNGINRLHEQDGKPPLTLVQAREGTLYWAKSSKN